MRLNRRGFLASLPAMTLGCTASSKHESVPAVRSVDGCPFCRIVAGSEATVVYRDNRVLAFADLYPLERGHLLVTTLTHVETLYDLEAPLAGALFSAASDLARAMREVFAPDGLSVLQNNQKAAGQVVPHVHIHLIPRWSGRDLFETVATRMRPEREELDATFRPLIDRVDRIRP